jgi:PAS domain S-box-containing protein
LPVAAGAILTFAWVVRVAVSDAPAQADMGDVLRGVGIGLILLVMAAVVAFELFVARPLSRLADHADGGGSGGSVGAGHAGRIDEIGQIARTLDDLQSRMAIQESKLEKVEAQRKQLEATLRLSEERYTLAVQSANDGMWEWNLQNDRMYFSPRWKSMLGFAESEIGDSREEWRRRVPDDEIPVVEAALKAHLDGRTVRYEHQHRLVHKSGDELWILSRGAAVRHASGKPYRMVGLDTDVTATRRIELILHDVAQGTAGKCGEAFFRSMVRHFARALKVPCAFVTECANYPTSRLRTLAFWSDEQFLDNFEYDLPGTPCAEVVASGKTCFHRDSVGTAFPREAGYEGYIGIPIVTANGRVVGHLAFLDRKPMGEEMLVDSIYRIFTARAAAELERRHLEASMLGLVQTLGSLHGEACFQVLARAFAETMEVREAIVTECIEKPQKRLHVLAWWRDGGLQPEVDYELKGSTCEETIDDGRICFYPAGVGERFPPARPFNRESYLGVPCFDSSGGVVGHIACFDDKAIHRELPDKVILTLFAERAAVEIERRRLSLAQPLLATNGESLASPASPRGDLPG